MKLARGEATSNIWRTTIKMNDNPEISFPMAIDYCSVSQDYLSSIKWYILSNANGINVNI